MECKPPFGKKGEKRVKSAFIEALPIYNKTPIINIDVSTVSDWLRLFIPLKLINAKMRSVITASEKGSIHLM